MTLPSTSERRPSHFSAPRGIHPLYFPPRFFSNHSPI
jgi:hypothetical protein